jgi:hypothetical protein
MPTATDDTETRHLSAVGENDEPENPPAEQSIEDLAESQPEPETPPTQLAIPGTRDKLTGAFGGKVPTDSELRIMGGKRPIEGQFEKGETITVLSTGTVRAVEGSDTDDDWGTVTKTTRIHKMRQIHVRVATPDALARELLAHLSVDEAVVLLKETAAGG